MELDNLEERIDRAAESVETSAREVLEVGDVAPPCAPVAGRALVRDL